MVGPILYGPAYLSLIQIKIENQKTNILILKLSFKYKRSPFALKLYWETLAVNVKTLIDSFLRYIYIKVFFS